MVKNFGGKQLWGIWQQLPINVPKFYLSIFCSTLISFCVNVQFANVFSSKHVLGANLAKFFTVQY